MRQGRVIFLDPSLGRASGHHAMVAENYNRLISRAGRRALFAGHRGTACDLPIFTHRLEDAFRVSRYVAPWVGSPTLAAGVRLLKRALVGSSHAALSRYVNGKALARDDFVRLFTGLGVGRALDYLWREVAPEPSDDLVVLGVDPALLSALSQRHDLFSEGGPGLHLVFMYPEVDFVAPAACSAYWDVARLVGVGAQSMHAERMTHAFELQHKLERAVGFQMTPVRLGPLESPPVAPFTVAALGAGRADKGFAILPEVARVLVGIAPEVVLRVQMPERGFLSELSALRALPNVVLLESRLSDDEYERELVRAHALIMPYDKERYSMRGSGVLVDALIGGRPFIATEGTTLADEGANSGAGLSANSAVGFARAVIQLRQAYPAVLGAAQGGAAAQIALMRNGSLLSALGCAS